MLKLIATLVVFMGIRELVAAFSVEENLKFLDDLTELAKVQPQWAKLTSTEQKRYFRIALRCLFRLPLDLLEVVVLVAGLIWFPSPLRWGMLAILLLGFVSHYFNKYAPKSLHKAWFILDHAYCAAIMILGPTFLL